MASTEHRVESSGWPSGGGNRLVGRLLLALVVIVVVGGGAWAAPRVAARDDQPSGDLVLAAAFANWEGEDQLVAATASTEYQAAVLLDAPYAYWRLDDSGTTASDSSGNARHATLQNGVLTGQAGAMVDGSAPAMGFDGTNDQILLPAGFNDFSTGVTLEAWVYPTAGLANTPFIFLGTGQNTDVVRLGTGATAGGADLAFTVFNTTSSWGTVTAPGVLRQNQWQHVAATLSGGQATVYVDGLRVAAGTVPTPTVANRTAAWLARAAVAGYVNGRLDEVAVYTTALSGSRVAAHYAASGRSLPQAVSPAPAYQAAVVADAPVAYWRLNEAADRGVAWDLTNNGNNAAIVGGVTRGAAGALPAETDTGMALNGTSGYLSVPDGFGDFSSGLTIELWVHPVTLATSTRLVDLSTGNNNNTIKLYVASTTGDLAYQVYQGTTAGTIVKAPGVLAAGSWQHLVVTQEAVTGTVTIYRNGLRVAQGSTLVPSTVTRTINYVGRSAYVADPYFAGSLDEVAVYTTALSGSRVAAHYAASGRSLPQAPTPAPVYQAAVVADGPLAYYRLGEPAGETVAWDLAGNTTGAPIVGGVTRGAVGALAGDTNTAMTLNGTTGYLTMPSGFAVGDANGVTIEMWVNPSAVQGLSRLIELSNGSSSDAITLFRNSTTNAVAVRVYRGGTVGATVTAPNALVLNTWTHLVATIDGAGAVKIYVNGVLAGSGSTAVPAAVTRNQNYLGRSAWGGEYWFAGSLDEVAVYGKVLSAAQVAAHYTYATAVEGPSAYRDLVLSGNPSGYWRLADPVGSSVVMDRSGNGRHGRLVGGPTLGGPSAIIAESGGSAQASPAGDGGGTLAAANVATDNSIGFDGVDDEVVMDGQLVSPSATGLTVATWIKPRAWTQSDGMLTSVIVGLDGDPNAADGSVEIYITNWALFVGVTYVDAAGQPTSYLIQYTTPQTLQLDQWYHVAMTMDGTNTVVYLNGQSLGAAASPMPASTAWPTMRSGGRAGAVAVCGDGGRGLGMDDWRRRVMRRRHHRAGRHPDRAYLQRPRHGLPLRQLKREAHGPGLGHGQSDAHAGEGQSEPWDGRTDRDREEPARWNRASSGGLGPKPDRHGPEWAIVRDAGDNRPELRLLRLHFEPGRVRRQRHGPVEGD